MPKIQNRKILPYKIDLLYQVITNVEEYNKFIPWCKKVTIITQDTQSLISDVDVEFLFIKERYRSVAHFFPVMNNIAKTEIQMLKGPFKHFSTLWVLEALENNVTLVEFECDFSFNKKLYDNIAKPVLMAANNKIIQSFIKRVEFISKLSYI